eukprot:gene18811-20707_t
MRQFFSNNAAEADAACKRGEFQMAIQKYSECIEEDPNNQVLFGNRSAAYIRNKQYNLALGDGIKASQLNPTWPKAHYRQGVALQHMNRHSEAMAAFATALAHDSASEQLLQTLIEAGLKSPLQATLSSLIDQLGGMGFEHNPFIITSIIGQELLSVKEVYPAITVLESALQIGTKDAKLKGSVFSALSSAHWKTGNTKRAMRYMEEDLNTAQELQDPVGQCRAHGNMGNAYYSQNMYKKSLKHHKLQMNIAMQNEDHANLTEALTSLGHVYVSIGDYSSALASHKRCLSIRKELNDRSAEGKELGSIGSVYTLMGDQRNAAQYHLESLRIAEDINDTAGIIKSSNNLGSLYYGMRNYAESVKHFVQALEYAGKLGEKAAECRALGGLGHTYRGQGKLGEAIKCHEKQLKVAIEIKDRPAEARARSNIGVVLQQKGQYRHALDFHKSHLLICRELSDKDGEGRACGNIGNAYHSQGQYERAIKYHKYAIALCKELRDTQSESSLHGNLAVAFQALEMYGDAEKHYKTHLEMTKNLSDVRGEGKAESNLGNFYIAKGDNQSACQHYQIQLSIAEKIDDVEEISKACHSLAYAYYLMEDYEKAIDHYERNIRLATELEDRASLSTVHCNLGLAYLAVNQYDKAVSNQKKFLIAASEKKNVYNICKALGNIGEVYFREENFSEALRYFTEKLKIADDNRIETLKAAACHKLGQTYLHVGNFKKAFEMFNKELTLNKGFGNLNRAFDCLQNIADICTMKKDYHEAYQSYIEQLDTASELKDQVKEAIAFHNIGTALIRLGSYQDAKSYFDKQLHLIKVLHQPKLEEAKCHRYIGNCYYGLKDYKTCLKHYEVQLSLVLACKSVKDQDTAYRCLFNVHKAMNNLQEARVCSEKRLVLSHESEIATKCEAYGDLGEVHCMMGNIDQAISCFESQKEAAQDNGNIEAEICALNGQGRVYEKQNDLEKALKFHQLEFQLAEKSENVEFEGKAATCLGNIYKQLGNFDEALKYYETALSVSDQFSDKNFQLQIHSKLAVVKHLLHRGAECVSHLQKVVDVADSKRNTREIFKTFYRLGITSFVSKDYDQAQMYFHKVIQQAYDVLKQNKGEIENESLDFVMASFEMLQRVYVSSGRQFEALKVAEKCRLFECELTKSKHTEKDLSCDKHRKEADKILSSLNNLTSTCLYYSTAAGHILMWLLAPGKGVIKFTMIPFIVGYGDEDFKYLDLDEIPMNASRLLTENIDSLIKNLRESIGVGAHLSRRETRRQPSFHSDMVDILPAEKMPLKKYSRVGQRATFSDLSPVTKSTYNFAMKPSSCTKVEPIVDADWLKKANISSLYNLLIRPVRNELQVLRSKQTGAIKLVIVVPNDLLLVPFSLLKDSNNSKFLCDKYEIRTACSLTFAERTNSVKNDLMGDSDRSIVIDGCESTTKTEAASISKMLNADVFKVSDKVKKDLKSKLKNTMIVHFAAKVSWSSSSLVLGNEDVGYVLNGKSNSEPELESLDAVAKMHCPSMPELLLTPNDIMQLDLRAKIVVFACSQIIEQNEIISSDRLRVMIEAFLLSGADAVIVSLWPVPYMAGEQFFFNLYKKFRSGVSASTSFRHSLCRLKEDVDYNHPINWAGYILYGKDASFTKKKISLAQTLHLLLERPNRDAIKVLLHLVEKCRQRIAQGRRTSMYTAEASVRAKVGDVLGWKELLKMVGFKFESATDEMPASLFFPSTDHVGILNRCSNTLYAFLGLTSNGLEAISKLRSAPEVAPFLISLLREVIEYFNNDVSNVQVPLHIKVWRIAGCHEFLSSLEFNLMGVGRDEVVLRSGRCNLRRPLQCALQAIIDLFEAEDPGNDFMCNVSGRAFSEVQLRGQIGMTRRKSLSHDSVDSGYHQMRKARSSPIKSAYKNNKHEDDEEDTCTVTHVKNGKRQPPDGANYHDLLSVNPSMGLFGSKGSDVDLKGDYGASARRLRGRGSNSNISTRPLLDEEGSLSSLNNASKLKKYSSSDALLDLVDVNQNELMPISSSLTDNAVTKNGRFSAKDASIASDRKTTPVKGSQNLFSEQRSNIKGRNTAQNSPARRLKSAPSDGIAILSDLSEEDGTSPPWKISEDSDTSYSSNTSSNRSSVKFRFDSKSKAKSATANIINDNDYYSKTNQSMVIRNRLAVNHFGDTKASIARGTTIIDALRLDKRDSLSSTEAVVIEHDKLNISSREGEYFFKPASISSASSDSVQIIENTRLNYDSPVSPPSSLPSSLSSVPSSEDSRNFVERFAAFQLTSKKRKPSVNNSLVISRI